MPKDSDDLTLRAWNERIRSKKAHPVLTKREQEFKKERERKEERRKLLEPVSRAELKRKKAIEKAKKKRDLFIAQAEEREAKARRSSAAKSVRKPFGSKPRKRSKAAKSIRWF